MNMNSVTEDGRMFAQTHNVTIEDRRAMTVSGVVDIDSFDESAIVIYTEEGELVVRGEELHIIKLSVDTGELALEGQIQALIYSEAPGRGQKGFFGKIFR